MTPSQKACYAVATHHSLVDNALVLALRHLKELNALTKKHGLGLPPYPENEDGLIQYLQQTKASEDEDLALLLEEQTRKLPRRCR